MGCGEWLLAHHDDRVQVHVLIELSVILVLGDDCIQLPVLVTSSVGGLVAHIVGLALCCH